MNYKVDKLKQMDTFIVSKNEKKPCTKILHRPTWSKERLPRLQGLALETNGPTLGELGKTIRRLDVIGHLSKAALQMQLSLKYNVFFTFQNTTFCNASRKI